MIKSCNTPTTPAARRAGAGGRAVAAGLAGLAGLALATSAQAAVLSFNGPGLFDLSDLSQVSYVEAGYRLSFDATAGSTALLVDGVGDGGSGGLVALSGGQFTLSRADGGLFSLLGLAAGQSPFDASGVADPMLGLQGLMGAVPVAMQDLLLTTGLANQGFGAAWTGLSALRFTTNGDAVLDNIAVNAVPEPDGWALLALALGGVALAGRARRPHALADADQTLAGTRA